MDGHNISSTFLVDKCTTYKVAEVCSLLASAKLPLDLFPGTYVKMSFHSIKWMKYGWKEAEFLFCIFCNPDLDYMPSPWQINITFTVDRDILCLLITWRRIQISARQGNAFLAPRRTLSFSANWMQKNLHKIMLIIISMIHFNLRICLIKAKVSYYPLFFVNGWMFQSNSKMIHDVKYHRSLF